MATVRIYKVAELLGLSSQDAMDLLKRETGIDVKSASSSIEEIVARQFVERQARKRQIALPPGPLFTDAPAAKKPGAKAKAPLSNMAMLELLRGMRVNGLTVHGFRSTFRDWAGDRTSFAREVIEHALAHKIKDKAEASYRRSAALEKRRDGGMGELLSVGLQPFWQSCGPACLMN